MSQPWTPGARRFLEKLEEAQEEAEIRRRLSIDAGEARRRAERLELDARRWARRRQAIPGHRARARARKTEAMLTARKDALFYRRLAGRLEQIDYEAALQSELEDRDEPPRPAIAFHALTADELREIDRLAMQDLDGEIKSAEYTPPKKGTP